jgi:pimeloyl-ACP methyl ester carboxylesterase
LVASVLAARAQRVHVEPAAAVSSRSEVAMPCRASALPFLIPLGLGFPSAAQKPPAPAELEAAAASLLATDDRTEAGRSDHRDLLARLDQAPPLDAARLAAWRTRIQKAWAKGKKLEPAGEHWFWPADPKKKTEARGRYIVGGQTQKPKGLVIAMHGGGIGAGDAGSAAGSYGAAATAFDLVMIAPEVLEKTECGWTDSGTEEFVLDLVDCALRTWKLDPDKVFFVGHSMGGYGSWALGGHHADRVAAIAPAAGAPTPIFTHKGGPIVDMQKGVIPSLRNVFVSVFQSLDDAQVPPGPNQFAVKQLRACGQQWGGFEHDYWEVDGAGHGAPPGGHEAQLAKIVKRVRDPVPERLVWQPMLAWKRQFHWLWWEQPVATATLVADLDRAGNQVKITAGRSTAGLWVLLDPRVLDLGKEVVVVVDGKETYRGKPAMSLATLVLTSAHPDPKLQFVARVPAFVPE